MNKIRKWSEGAYFVPSYSEQTVMGYIPGITNQFIVNSPDLQEIQDLPVQLEELQDIYNPCLEPEQGYTQFDEILDELVSIKEECMSENWDDQGAKQINTETITEAVTFLNKIETLPNKSIITPGVSPAPNGSIIFEWRDDNAIFTISFIGQNKLIYTFVNDMKRIAEIEDFNNQLPEKVINLLLNHFQSV